MAKPVNLNRYRKEKARSRAAASADENAVRFGRTKSQKQRDRLEEEKAARDLDGHKQDP